MACVAALENLRILVEEKLVEKVALETGPHLKARFASLTSHPLVGHAETCGLAAGLNLVKRKGETVHECEAFPPLSAVGMLCRGFMFDNGVIMRAVGDRMIVAPPLSITVAEIDEMVEKIRYCLDLTFDAVKEKGLLE